jgi:hypothetical protein
MEAKRFLPISVGALMDPGFLRQAMSDVNVGSSQRIAEQRAVAVPAPAGGARTVSSVFAVWVAHAHPFAH